MTSCAWMTPSVASNVNVPSSLLMAGQRTSSLPRMQLARGRLRSSTDTVARVGASLGYQSEATFSRAYRRTFGVSPGSDRTPADDHDGSSEMMTAQSLR